MLPQWVLSLDGGPRRVNHSAVIIDHKIYTFGGYCMGENYQELNPIDVHILNTCMSLYLTQYDNNLCALVMCKSS